MHNDIDAKLQFLHEQDIFRDLAHRDIELLMKQLTMVEKRRGLALFSQGDLVDSFYLLKSGSIKLYRIDSGGHRLELASLEPGTFIGEVPLGHPARQNACAQVTDDALLCVISRDNLADIFSRYPSVAMRVIEALNSRVSHLETQLASFAYKDLPSRLASVLINRYEAGCSRSIKITHQELADLTGTIRETVTRTLAQFKVGGIVEVSRGAITIIDPEGLRAITEERQSSRSPGSLEKEQLRTESEALTGSLCVSKDKVKGSLYRRYRR